MKIYCRTLLAAMGFLLVTPCVSRADSPTVGSDGAVGVNLSWETGKSSAWYIELQRQGATDITTGIEREDDSLIREGILIVNWGFAHEASDGSYTDTGDPFHSTAIFAEAVAYSARQLQQYRPSTYTADTAYYGSVVTAWIKDLHRTAQWLTTPSIASQGQQFDQPYTHRRYLLAAALGQIGLLSGDSALRADAVPYVQDGLALQIPSGTETVTYGDGSVHTVKVAGVNPEAGGYDVSYQCAGIAYAEHYYDTCADATLRSQLRAMMMAGLKWECGRISVAGVLDTNGSTRIGVELNRDGTVKEPNAQEIISALAVGAVDSGQPKFLVSAYRYAYYGRPVTSDTVASDGSVNGNTAWENKTASSWSIAQQRIGADYIDQGVLCENDAMIRQGIQILNWGWKYQLSDGSFGTTSTPYFAPAQFIEATSRASLALKAYSPATYTADTAYYASVAAAFATKSNKTANWYIKSANWPTVMNNAAPSSVRQYAIAAGLATTASAAANTAYNRFADKIASLADQMQTSSGMAPEYGAADINNQALSMAYAARYVINSPADSATAQTSAALADGLVWEMQWISLNGAVSGTPDPATKTIDTAMKLGYGLLADPRFMVARQRLNLPEMLLY